MRHGRETGSQEYTRWGAGGRSEMHAEFCRTKPICVSRNGCQGNALGHCGRPGDTHEGIPLPRWTVTLRPHVGFVSQRPREWRMGNEEQEHRDGAESVGFVSQRRKRRRELARGNGSRVPGSGRSPSVGFVSQDVPFPVLTPTGNVDIYSLSSPLGRSQGPRRRTCEYRDGRYSATRGRGRPACTRRSTLLLGRPHD